MAQQQSPWLEGAYGWNFGEGGWNTGMDQNLLKFSFMFDRNIDGIVGSLPAAVNGQAYFLTTDNRLYFAVGATWFSTPLPKWFEFVVRSTGETYQFNGTVAVQIDSPSELTTRLDAVELTLSTLGTAAFEDVGFFATQAELDVVEANSQAYTDDLSGDIADTSDPAKGIGQVGGGQRAVSTIAALATLGPSVTSVNVLHRASIADQGGGQFDWVSGDQSANVTADPLQGVWVAPDSDATGASGAYRRAYTSLDFRFFGASDDGTDAAGTTAAINATYAYLKFIGGGSVRDDKGGQFALNDTIIINGDRISSIFAGKNVTRFTRTDGAYGNTFHIAPDDPVNNRLNYIIFGRCSIEQLTNEMTSGAHIFAESLIHSTIFQQHWWNGFKSFTFKGLQQCLVNDTRVDTGSFMTSGVVVGSKFVECLHPDSVHENGEVFFSDFNWTFTGNAATEIGLDIRACDGLWFSNGHIFGAQTECRITPQTGTVQLEGVHFTQVWFDGFCTTNLSISSNTTGGFGEFYFNNCRFTGATGIPISITAGATDLQNVEFNGGMVGNCSAGYMSLLQGDAITVTGMQMMDGNRNAAATTAVIVGSGVREFNMTGGPVGTHTPADVFAIGIDIQGASVNANIHGVPFKNVTNEINLVGHLGLGSNIGGNSTSRATYNTVTAAATIAIPGVAETIELSGGTNVEQINYGWDGRTIVVRAVGGTQTLVHNTGAGAGKIFGNAGANISLLAGRSVRLTYSVAGGGWYQSV